MPSFSVPHTVACLSLLAIPTALFLHRIDNSILRRRVALNALCSLIAYCALVALIPRMQKYLLTAGLSGIDLNKRDPTLLTVKSKAVATSTNGTAATTKPDADDTKKYEKPIPESLGVVSGIVYVTCLILLQLLYITHESHNATHQHSNKMTDSLHLTSTNTAHTLVQYNSALASILFMILLGFVDDVVDLPWRYKLILPTVASLPLLCTYTGSTTILLPRLLTQYLPQLFSSPLLELGLLYQVYMGLLAVFVTNSINIYAGINGLEVGQSLVIAVSICCHNILELAHPNDSSLPLSEKLFDAVSHVLAPSYEATIHSNHLFSLFIMIPFIGCCCGLLKFNWFPSRVFIGDTFTYQAGMTFACVGILGHFSKTLLLFFIPQIVNFLVSAPQILRLFGLTCPRHRLPRFNAKTGKLEGQTINHNLVNGVLLILGPMTEERLCVLLLAMQVACCALGLFLRYEVAQWFY